MNEVALIVGWLVLGTAAIIGTLTLLGLVWWKFLEDVLAPRVGTNRLFFETAARILKERKAEDRGQLSKARHWPLRRKDEA